MAESKEESANLQVFDYMGIVQTIAQNYGGLLSKLFVKAFPDDLVEGLEPEQALAYLKDAQSTFFTSMEFMRKVQKDILLGADEPFRRLVEKLMGLSSMQFQQIKDQIDGIQVKK